MIEIIKNHNLKVQGNQYVPYENNHIEKMNKNFEKLAKMRLKPKKN